MYLSLEGSLLMLDIMGSILHSCRNSSLDVVVYKVSHRIFFTAPFSINDKRKDMMNMLVLPVPEPS